MSLIPNESYSFPDHFLRAQSRARAQHQKNLAAPPTITRESTPSRPIVRTPAPIERTPAPIESTPTSAPIERMPAPVESTPAPVHRAPAPIVRAPDTPPRAAAPPVKVSANVRPRGLTPRPAPLAKPTRPAFVPRQPGSQPKIPKSARHEAPAVDEFQFDLFPEKTHRRNNRPHRGKLLRFFLFEGLAALVLAPCAVLILLRYLTDPTLIMVTNIAAIASAIALAIIPIVFFAIGPTLPRGEG